MRQKKNRSRREAGRNGTDVLDVDGVMAMQSRSDIESPTRWLYASLVVLATVVLLTLFQGLVGTVAS
jgi:hypothetical protein